MTAIKKRLCQGVQWLETNCNSDGYWGIAAGFQSDIASTLFAIWAILVASNDFDRWRSTLDWILSQQNSDGGWPAVPGKKSVMFSVFYLRTILITYYARTREEKSISYYKTSIERVLEYILQAQHPNGGWSSIIGGDPNVHDTCHALGALKFFARLSRIPLRTIKTNIKSGILFLIDQRHTSSGGWGLAVDCPPDVHQTAHAIETLRLYDSIVRIEERTISEGFNYLLENQQEDGGWTIADGSIDNTAQVFMTFLNYHQNPPIKPICWSIRWLLYQQKKDGGWCSSLRTPTSCTLLTGANVAQIILAKEKLGNAI